MKLQGVELRRVAMPLVSPFRTSFGTQTARDILLLRAVTTSDRGDAEGWGECVAMSDPLYSSEYVDATADVLRRLPAARAGGVGRPAGPARCARGRVRCCTSSRATGWPRPRSRWPCSTPSSGPRAGRGPGSWGPSTTACPPGSRSASSTASPQLLDAVDGYLDAGYVRIKLKIEPGWDVEPVRAVRERFGDDVLLQVDANTAYTLRDARHLARLDAFDLLLIEQPLEEEDVLGHAELARQHLDAGVPGRVDRLGTDRRGRHQPGCLRGHQHQARPGRRLPRGGADPRPRGRPRPGRLVRRHGRDGPRPGGQRGARRAARIHPARRHLRIGPLLRDRHHRAARPARTATWRCRRDPGWA